VKRKQLISRDLFYLKFFFGVILHEILKEIIPIAS